MAYNNYQQFPFWDFVRAFDNQHGAGVDHQAEGFPGPQPHPEETGDHQHPAQAFGFGGPFGWGGGFGRGPWGGRGGHRGRHGPGQHGGPHERRGSRGPSRERGPEGERPEGEPADGPSHGRRGGRHHHGRREHSHSDGEHSGSDRESSPHGRRGPRGCGRRGRGGPHGHGPRGWGGHPRGPPPPPFGGPGGFDMSGLMQALSNHPLAQAFRGFAEQAPGNGTDQQRSGTIVSENDDVNSFVPPVDVFSTERAYVLHIALPGAKKEDVGVHWDEDKGVLNIAGVVYRQGDEEFLQTLAQSERKVGVFERIVKLPPGDAEKEEVDGAMITAKLEDGVLVVTVPKVEKEWTEVKKVDIM
ncbi:HSP20-like chaperone [Glarea lozoyensis ATCC 20868]|uniref:HSP20-like chaperone n=1 Tax=Glarea lozoyensis (strain ATCC 20868 / MF5171) TaxID=1116229 RepID=S3CXC0_GLAL2|nr:HSP20-like chaperone [Glarea lozoyensis ATCC 20868]EPE29579.1 HSP20-like chaperone [Glarea lozoyensis ATCC 20868]